MENETLIYCVLCAGDGRFVGEKNHHSIYRCRRCSLLSVYPIPPVASMYDREYFNGAEHGFGYVDYEQDKTPMIPTFEVYLDHIRDLGVSSGHLLDVGAATGFFMDIAKRRGFDTTGVELSDFAAQQGRNKGHTIFTGTLEDIQFPKETFDVITLFDVLEHVQDPVGFLNEVQRVLKPHGLVVINTPDSSSVLARLLGVKWHLVVPPEHLHYFSSQILKQYLEKKGFVVRKSTKIGKIFTPQYIFKMLHAWQRIRFWKFLSEISSNPPFSRFSFPINLRDNFFMIVEKQ